MSKLNIFEEYADLFEAEDIDPKEYDYEGEMAKDQLVTMADAASELHDMLDDTENLPEWCQNKISKATDYIDTVRDYMLAKKTKAGGDELDDIEKDMKKEMKEYKELNPTKAVNKMVNTLAKKVKSMKNEISVAARNKYYDSAKKDIERAKSSAVGKILRGKEADGTRHDHSIELKRIARREKGIKTAKNQAIKNIRGELYGKKKKNESVDEKFSITMPPAHGGKKMLNVSMGGAIQLLKKHGATKDHLRTALSGRGGSFKNDKGHTFKVQAESVNEISKKTAGSYIKKRIYDVGSAAGRMGADFGIGPEEKKKNREKAVRQYVKYQKGMNRATDKLTGKAKVPATENVNPTLEEWKKSLSESVYTEKLKVSDGMGAWVKDFQKSDAPQFKGKNDKERRDMAVAAYLSAKRGD